MQLFFSQGIAVLFSQAPGLAELRLLLEREGYTATAVEEPSKWPEMQGACITLATDFENGAQCWVDICEFPWPDDLGTSGTPTLATGAHMLGAFGPFVHPGAFTRALNAPGYQAAAEAARGHRAFVRFRISRLIPATPEAPEASFASDQNANPAQEFLFLLRAAVSLARMPGALAYFNPNSELLLPLESVAAIITSAYHQKCFPIEALCRARGAPVEETWSFIDCIGMAQLGRRDHEFAWEGEVPGRQEQVDFLLDVLHYEAESGAVMAGGHTTDGPHGTRWRAEERENSCMLPPRQILHWTIQGSGPEPAALAGHVARSDEPESALSPGAYELVSKLEAWLAMRDTIRQRAVNWLRSPSFRTVYYDDAHVPLAVKSMLDATMSKKEAREAWQGIQFLGQQTPELWNQYQQLATHGQVWFAVPMMSNPNFNKDIHTSLPCGAVVAEKQTSEQILAASAYAMVAYDLYAGEGDKAARPATARMMSDDSYRLFYREAFPPEETGGGRFMLLSVLMRNSWMPPEDVPFIPFLAMPGPRGAIAQIPWHIATGTPPLPGSMEPGRFAEAAALDRTADAMVAEHNSKRFGCWNMISLIFWIIFIAGILGAIAITLFEKPTPKKAPKQAPAAGKAAN